MASTVDLEREGNSFFVDEDYEAAVDSYTRAIEAEPDNSSLYERRAAAYTKLENFTDAIVDANKAIQLQPSSAKAYLRKGIACFSLEEYQTARAAFQAGATLEPTNSSFKTWLRKCEAELSDEIEARASLEEQPATPLQQPPSSDTARDTTPLLSFQVSEVSTETTNTSSLPPPPPKYRHEWYQSSTNVVVSVLAKGINAEDLQVEFGEQILSVVIKQSSGEPYVLQLRLFGKINAAESNYTLLKTKVELRMPKAESIQWTGLDYGMRKGVDQPINVSDARLANVKTKYPSSKNKEVDWDKLEAKMKEEEKDEKLEGDAALNRLFQNIYKDADEDTRRAMNKSFVESSGTVLSTNWKEVKEKTVEGRPPT
eukprot:jgi/Mesen1/10496/ME000083S09999